MKHVKYVAMIDKDEMILPVSNNSWPEMLKTLEKEGKYASYTFSILQKRAHPGEQS